jgi:flagellar hook-associated protein 2
MGGFSVSGANTSSSSGSLGAGIDVTSTVAALMQVERLPESQMQTQQTTFNSQAQVLQGINTDLTSLQTAVQTLTDFTGQLNARTTTSSNANVVTASANGTAALGSHQVVVNNLATTSSFYSSSAVTSSTAIATGSFNIGVGTAKPVTITIDSSNNTLAQLAQTINAANAGVTASVITDSSGARLALLSSTSGAAGEISITPTTAGPTPLSFTEAGAKAVDASLTIDGIPVDSASNTVTNVLPGVTLSLQGANPGTTVSVGVAPDVATASTAVQTFVSSYNTAINAINAQFAFTGATGSTAPPLLGNSSLESVQAQLYSALSYSTTGNNNGINTLSDLGITQNADGTLTLNTSQLTSALTSNNAAVQNFFQTASTGFAQQLNTTLSTITDPTKGPLYLEISGINSSLTSVAKQISDFEVRMSTVQQQLTAEYDLVQTTLQQMPLLLAQTNSQLASLG